MALAKFRQELNEFLLDFDLCVKANSTNFSKNSAALVQNSVSSLLSSLF